MTEHAMHGCLLGERRGETDHVVQRLAGKTTAKLMCQLSPHCGDNLLPVFRPYFPQNVLVDTCADLPVKHRQFGIDRLRHPAARLQNQLVVLW